MRYYGKVVFEKDESMKTLVLEKNVGLKKFYNEQTGHKLGVFHLEASTVEFHVMSKLISSNSL